ncbi:sulfatase family protein [Maribellus maritimus]|uniref:sulfatase family protein n=1 Tax=Maribellus maritimus TaxID=2870838 RepID=UPI001EEABD02|nr:sulfatase [Maribellus maritimus]MCG6189587.1 sulfatase [Maribellus maritimus]
MKRLSVFLILFLMITYFSLAQKRPNILFAIADDQSFSHTGFAGCNFVKTPAFDRVAAEGIYFTNCYAGSPGCAPSRSTIVTGRYHWQNEQSGQHASSWLKKYVPFVDMLDKNGYYTGRTGKGVGPFQYARNEGDSLWRKEDAAGVARSNIRYTKENDERTAGGIHTTNYFENFKYFMEHQPENEPFFFWYGCYEPHRAYEEDSWKRTNKKIKDAKVPLFLPDDKIIRGDLLDYAVEIEWFDLHLQRMLDYLEEIGELENTIVIVTADNGMPFPRAKANGFEYGVHVPLAVRYPKEFPSGKVVDSPVSFVDFAPTILELTESSAQGMKPIFGKSMKPILENPDNPDAARAYVFAGRERHSSSRYKNWGYPQRVIRSKDFLLIWNMKPERWPAGAPQRINPENPDELLPMYGIDENGVHHSDWAYTDIDACPTKSFIVENRNDKNIYKYFEWSVGKRPEFELYDIKKDPECLDNLAGDQKYQALEKQLKSALLNKLKETGDPRVTGPNPEVFDSYLRYSPMRQFPEPEQ